MQQILQAMQDGSLILDLKSRSLHGVFHQVANFLVAREVVPSECREELELALAEKEKKGSTAIGHALSVPHVYLEMFEEPVVVFVRLDRPLNLGAPDGVPTRFFFVLLGPPDTAALHLDTLAGVARLMSDDEFRFDAGEARNRQQLLDAFRRFTQRSAPAKEKPAREISDGLKFTGKPAGGMLADLRRRIPYYASDLKDGLHLKCLGSILFLFFACLAPTVTFGGVMAASTDNQIGVVEMIAATAMCGVFYALFSGQPLVFLGGTGPLLVFIVILFSLCRQFDLPFLPTYACVGVWTSFFLILMAVFDASALMRFFTRFTDESFAALISIIFIYEAISALAAIFFDVYRTETATHDKAFLSLILALGTFYIASNLSAFRRSRYLRPKVREFLSDFGPAIALALMTLVAVWFHGEVVLDALKVPKTFGPTTERAWLVNPFTALPTWVLFASALPALFGAILVFLDQNITVRLVNSPDHHLAKGEAYHWDLALAGGLVGVCSIFGLPWLVAATVRSLNHVRSLATMEEIVSKNGDTREKVVHVRENRITPLAIHALIGFSLLLLPWLQMIPLAVLFGVFLYMGVVSIKGNQFFERMSLMVMDSSLYPSTHYIRRVPMSTIHKFTAMQIICLVILWVVKTGSPALAIFFPLFIALLVVVRIFAGRFFKPEHLAALDAEEEPKEEELDWGSG